MKCLLNLLFLANLAVAGNWLFSGYVRLSVPPMDIGIARALAIPLEEIYQTKIVFSAEQLNSGLIKISFVSCEQKYIKEGIQSKAPVNQEDSLISRKIILEKTATGIFFYDDPDHVLSERLSFDPNLLCLLYDLTCDFPTPKTISENEKSITHIWSMPYVNQDDSKVISTLTAILPKRERDNQVFNIIVSRDEIRRNNNRQFSSVADGLGDGYISRDENEMVNMVTANIHLSRSILYKDKNREGRVGMIEDVDFILETQPTKQ
jgi:hypothetical protein